MSEGTNPGHERLLEVQVQGDFISRLTAARPVQALIELIWNALDAESTKVSVRFEESASGLIDSVIVSDDGHGIPYVEIDGLFTSLGGSWKRDTPVSKNRKRMLHGEEGKGRFRALAIGRVAEWIVTSKSAPDALETFRVLLIRDEPRRVRVSESLPASKEATQGVQVRITELYRQLRIDPEILSQELAETFALYLIAYPEVEISALGRRVDPASLITNQKDVK